MPPFPLFPHPLSPLLPLLFEFDHLSCSSLLEFELSACSTTKCNPILSVYSHLIPSNTQKSLSSILSLFAMSNCGGDPSLRNQPTEFHFQLLRSHSQAQNMCSFRRAQPFHFPAPPNDCNNYFLVVLGDSSSYANSAASAKLGVSSDWPKYYRL